jgi:hypothetical protein
MLGAVSFGRCVERRAAERNSTPHESQCSICGLVTLSQTPSRPSREAVGSFACAGWPECRFVAGWLTSAAICRPGIGRKSRKRPSGVTRPTSFQELMTFPICREHHPRLQTLRCAFAKARKDKRDQQGRIRIRELSRRHHRVRNCR